MSRRIDIAYTTLAAELLDRSLDAQFDADFDEAGAFVKVRAKDRDYWYYKPSVRGGREDKRVYVGPVDDVAITARVNGFRDLKSDFQARRRLVSTLTREGRLFAPQRDIGNIVEALWKAGIFRLRACLIGTIAFQTYGTLLGYRLAGAALQTGDIDIAQFHPISLAVGDTIPPILDVLRVVDQSFHAAPALNDVLGITKFIAKGGLRVEFLTPNRGSEDFVGKPTPMPALGGASAEPLRFLDFLIREPVRNILLHKGGVPIVVPDPARFAVHKLIVAARRTERGGKADKDLAQTESLVEAFEAVGRTDELLAVFDEAWARGQAWREAINTSLVRMRALNLLKTSAALRTA